MISELLLMVFLAEGSGDGAGAAPAPSAQGAAAPKSQAPAPADTSAAPAPESKATREKADVKKKPQNPHVPTPFGPNTTNPSLDASRSTVIPDREALPQEFQDIPLAPLGPAPPDTTPTQEGGGARRINEIKMPSPTGEEKSPSPGSQR